VGVAGFEGNEDDGHAKDFNTHGRCACRFSTITAGKSVENSIKGWYDQNRVDQRLGPWDPCGGDHVYRSRKGCVANDIARTRRYPTAEIVIATQGGGAAQGVRYRTVRALLDSENVTGQ
jgi:hypothetical protein